MADIMNATPERMTALRAVLFDQIENERRRQDAKWGQQDHNDDYWLGIVMEEIGEVAKAVIERDDEQREIEMVHALAVLTGWWECIVRRGDGSR